MNLEVEIIEYGKRISHFGYYDILRWMHEEYGKAPSITLVYKALQKLEEQGKVKRLSFDSGVKYEVPE